MLCKKYYIICIYLILYTNPLLYCLKAFKLLVDGGQHPRGKTSVNVTGIGHDAAAQIFYDANVNCLTASSTFSVAKYCTADQFGGNFTSNVKGKMVICSP